MMTGSNIELRFVRAIQSAGFAEIGANRKEPS